MNDSSRIASIVRFESFRLDLAVGELTRDGELVPLRPKAMAVLVELVEQAGSLVPRGRLLEAGWGDANVDEDAALHSAVREVRQALGDAASEPRFVATVHRRGYRFVAPVCDEAVNEPSPPVPTHIRPSPNSSRLSGLAAVIVVGAGLVLAWTGASPPDEPSGDALVEASGAVLRARYLVGRGAESAINEGADILRDVVSGGGGGQLAWSGLAVAELRTGRFAESRAAAMRTLVMAPDDVDANRVLGQIEAMDGDLEAAEVYLLRALERDTGTGRSQHAYAYFLGAAGRIDEAVAMADAARNLAGRNGVAQSNFARYLLYAGEYERARAEAAPIPDLEELGSEVRLSALDTLQSASWALGDYGPAREAAVRYAELLGASESEAAAFRAADARAGAEAALRWRVAYHDRRAEKCPNQQVWASVVLAQLGEPTEALERLGALLDDPRHATSLRGALNDDRLVPLRSSRVLAALHGRYRPS